MKSSRKLILVFIGVVVVALAITGLAIYPKVSQQWSAPLGPSLALPTYTPTIALPTETPAPTAAPTQPGTAPANSLTATPEAPTQEPTATVSPLCGGPL